MQILLKRVYFTSTFVSLSHNGRSFTPIASISPMNNQCGWIGCEFMCIEMNYIKRGRNEFGGECASGEKKFTLCSKRFSPLPHAHFTHVPMVAYLTGMSSASYRQLPTSSTSKSLMYSFSFLGVCKSER